MRSATRIISFAPAVNSPGKKDVSGAFLPERSEFSAAMRRLGAQTEELDFDNRRSLQRRAAEIRAALAPGSGYDVVTFFCHGWLDGIQAGFKRKNAAVLAQSIAAAASGAVTVVLYCCSTGEDPKGRPLTAAGTGDNSFADRLRDELCALGQTDCRVVAHSTAAHTTRNPYVLFFDGLGSRHGGSGGLAPVLPGRELWPRWRAELRSDFRFRFPLLEIADIHAALANGHDIA